MNQYRDDGFREVYLRAAGGVAFVAVTDAKGDAGIGSAFHIGQGIFLTARHVVEDVMIDEIATTKSARLAVEDSGHPVAPRRLPLVDGPYFGADDLDVAVFRVDLGGTPLPVVTVSGHTDYDLGENDLVLSDVLVIGYPPIPFTTIPFQVVTLGQINAVVHVRHSSALHFIASAMARGGFSGGPVLDQEGRAVALVTESLGQDGAPAETGYMSLLSIAPAVDLASEKCGFSLHDGEPGRYSDALFAARFANPAATPLNSLIYDANIYVYDDDRDVFMQIDCVDEVLRAAAVEAFSAVVPLHRDVGVDGAILTPQGNPPAADLLKAGEHAAAVLIAAGYREVFTERSQWQLRP